VAGSNVTGFKDEEFSPRNSVAPLQAVKTNNANRALQKRMDAPQQLKTDYELLSSLVTSVIVPSELNN
jgi:hypothetical protein